jgi:hypothetical protein
MDTIFEPNENFNFENITLGQPNAIQGGAYFTRILYNNKSLYIQSPKCVSKQGIIKSGKKIYIDLLFNNNDESIVQWFINLENTCQKRIFDKSNEWFQNPLELSDIESAFTSPIKVYKSCKYYILKSNIKTNYLNGNPMIKIFNENEDNINAEDINSETNFISILEIQGIKFTTRNFQIEVEVKQIMTMNIDVIFENCLIKKNTENNFIQELKNVKQQESGEKINEEDYKIKKQLENQDEKTVEKSTNNELSFHEDDNINENRDYISNCILNDIIENSNNNDTLGIVGNIIDNNIHSDKIELLNNETNNSESDILESDNKDLNEIILDIEELLPENLNTLEIPTIKLKKPNEVYYDLFKKAKIKAKEAKKLAIQSYLEAKKIKEIYLLEDVDLSDEDYEDNEDDEHDEKNDEDEDFEFA